MPEIHPSLAPSPYVTNLKLMTAEMATIANCPEADAVLMGDCAALTALADRFNNLDCDHPLGSPEEARREVEHTAISIESGPILARICTMPARTMAGVRAKARALLPWQADSFDDDQGSDLAERLVASILRDLIAV